jgi:hypothetical protein
MMVNNADWLVSLRYIEFLRDIVDTSVSTRLLAAESYRIALERGLNLSNSITCCCRLMISSICSDIRLYPANGR